MERQFDTSAFVNDAISRIYDNVKRTIREIDIIAKQLDEMRKEDKKRIKMKRSETRKNKKLKKRGLYNKGESK